MGAQAKLEDDDPRVVAWEKFKQTDEYQNARRWAARVADESAMELAGSLWRCFIEGWSQSGDDLKHQLEEERAHADALAGALEDIQWKSADKDNMEFTARITCYQQDRIRNALTAYRKYKEPGE